MVLDYLQNQILPDLLQGLPFLRKNSLILFYGSAVSGNDVRGSDIDILLLMPLAVKNKNRERIYAVRNRLLNTTSVELNFPFSLEELEPEKIWNNDMLLSILHEAKVIHDPENRFPALVNRHQKYPQKVLKEKMLFAFYLLLQSQHRIKRNQLRGNKVDVVNQRIKALKIIMLIYKLKENQFFNAKDLYPGVMDTKLQAVIDQALNNVKTTRCDQIIGGLSKKLEKEAISKKLVPKKLFKDWEKWPTEKLSYTINWMML
ncbi:MAG: nucleotidyltransferase domain-containing protein [Candidatus Uhrbacteria bacterium]